MLNIHKTLPRKNGRKEASKRLLCSNMHSKPRASDEARAHALPGSDRFSTTVLGMLATGFMAAAGLACANTVNFSTTDPGINTPMTNWAIGWIGNTSQSIDRLGAGQIDSVRIGCPKEWALDANEELVPAAQADVDQGMAKVMQVAALNPNVKVAMVCSGGNGINSWYVQDNGVDIRGTRWLALFKATKHYVENAYGLEISYIEVGNEQDWGGKKGTKSNIDNIMERFQDDAEMGGFPQVGPSTLDCDNANSWYNAIKTHTDWGATHAINGSKDNYISFLQQVSSDGKAYFGSEIHNLAEMIMGTEYGSIGGCWWNTASVAAGRFVNACQLGPRICYEEIPNKFGAACGFREEGTNRIYLFAGSRGDTSVTFNCTDKLVYFDGVGPQSSVTVDLAGGDEVVIEVTVPPDEVGPELLYSIVDSTNLSVVWPRSHLGWMLEAQTNSNGGGLGAGWSPIPGSTNNNRYTFAVDAANPSVFVRLRSP